MSTEFTRREIVAVGVAAAAGVTVGATTAVAVDKVANQSAEGTVGEATVPFHGHRQAGIATPLHAKGLVVAFDLLPDVDRQALARLMRLWTTDIALLMAGQPAMADSNPEIAATPARLTVTVGLGFGAFAKADLDYEWPIAIRKLPDYLKIDALEPEWCDGDLVLQICSDDALTIAHAARELEKDARPFAKVRWRQDGFAPAAGVNPGQTARNLFGQVDGTRNPKPTDAQFDYWIFNRGDRHTWFADGTAMVVRRIRMNLDKWETLKPADQEKVIGRNRVNGAPLTGKAETDDPDFEAKDASGNLVIAEDSHMRRASFEGKILRRPFSYEDGLLADGTVDCGLLFISFQAEIEQFMTIQDSLANSDALNRWTTPVGSALFAVLPGAMEGQWLGQALLGE